MLLFYSLGLCKGLYRSSFWERSSDDQYGSLLSALVSNWSPFWRQSCPLEIGHWCWTEISAPVMLEQDV